MKNDFTFTLDRRDYITFQSMMKKMDKIEANRYVKSGLKSGIELILQQGRSNLAQRNNVKTGNLKKSLSRTVRKTAAIAGFKRTHTSAQGSKISGGNHAHLIDRGTQKRWTKARHYTGSISKSRPNQGSLFWTDAVEGQGPKALRQLTEAVYDAMNNITKN